MGVYSDGSYNVPAGLIYSFPVTCRNGEWTIVQGMYLTLKLLYGKWTFVHGNVSYSEAALSTRIIKSYLEFCKSLLFY